MARVRSHSGSTIRPVLSNEDKIPASTTPSAAHDRMVRASLSVHDESMSREPVVFAESFLTTSGLTSGTLVEIRQTLQAIEVRDFESQPTNSSHERLSTENGSPITSRTPSLVYLCTVVVLPSEQANKQHNLEVSVSKQIASHFNFSSQAQVTVTIADRRKWSSSHVEISFKDAYLSRSDMWRFVSQEFVGKTVYIGQKVSFLNSLKATVRAIHVKGRHAQAAYFDNSTVPVFRSEAARYVIFIQMSSEMWDFDSEGNGEILFNRVVNGFLPELFRRWSTMEVRHLVSIVMFGRLEYKRSELAEDSASSFKKRTLTDTDKKPVEFQDFYRVVVTDMASAQWTTILDELKKDFRVFLRDVSLFKTPNNTGLKPAEPRERPKKITGRLSGALKGNILEAINLAASQFSQDYIDRDLIRTGISTVVITAGSGVFDVDHDLLKLTSEMLTNNGIGIDIVCLSKMPLHSVPLFRWRLPTFKSVDETLGAQSSASTSSRNASLDHASLPDLSHSPAFSSANASVTYFSNFPSAFPADLPQIYGYGIPHWIDLSYWSSDIGHDNFEHKRRLSYLHHARSASSRLFVPRVRMYELQMMGLMESRMAEIIVPYLNEPSNSQQRESAARVSQSLRSGYSRSLSRSPELNRKTSLLARRCQAEFQFPRDQKSLSSSASAAMDRYDETVFEAVQVSSRKTKVRKKSGMKKARGTRPDPKRDKNLSRDSSTNRLSSSPRSGTKIEAPPVRPTATGGSTGKTRPARASRSISYMLRGLTPMKAAVATPEVRVENIAAQKLTSELTDGSSDEGRPKLQTRIGSTSRSSQLAREHDGATSQSSRPSTATSRGEGSKPIKINHSGIAHVTDTSITKKLWQKRRENRDDTPRSSTYQQEESTSDSEGQRSNASTAADSDTDSSPKTTIPYIRNVNASNPLKKQNDAESFGRWQHLYPSKPRSATVKWRSLCTPASVPLTTEDFPSKSQLKRDYDAVSHVVPDKDGGERTSSTSEDGHALLLEMISLRVAHGYQFVIGKRVADTIGEPIANPFSICQNHTREQPSLVVVLAMANIIQKLELQDSSSVRVVKYIQRRDDDETTQKSLTLYSPYLRTILSKDYFQRNFRFQGFSEHYPWEVADYHLAGNDEEPRKVVEQLRYWRARYVLLPVEPPVSTWKTQQTDENEEEIHLLGIRALTQMWQKNRYVTAEERRLLQSRSGSMKFRDINPLEVKMETLNPSELVAMELDRLSQTEERDREKVQLLPEVARLDQESSMQKFASAMQSDHGIEIKSRRWHWKNYANCFSGEEFTNWMLQNVKNLSNREEAVAFGNQLMKEGLFDHVNGRHGFKDGTYFYSLRTVFLANRPQDPRGSWMTGGRQPNKSVPPAAISEQGSREASLSSARTRSGSNIAQQLQATSSTSESVSSAEKKRKAVSLSRMIRVDVDPRKKSFGGRREVLHVHYDRFHNPENCYHLELNWLSTTCKLVDDAIISWTNTAEKYGLKLVEVPGAEAYNVPVAEPFRNPYRIKLALEPPKQKPNSIVFSSVNFSISSLGSQHVSAVPVSKHIYQKAILKRCNFVLDLEAVSEFPEGIDIHYSWGQLDYKYTQFVHRSGVILAQILDDGDIILLANRLYNSRLANTKEANNRTFDHKRDVGPHANRPAVPPSVNTSMQASGIVGINLASPAFTGNSSPSLHAVANLASHHSPVPRPYGHHLNIQTNSYPSRPAIADSFGPKSAFASTGLWNTFITPEQIKDDLEAFCHDKVRLEHIYREVMNTPTPVSAGPGSGSRKTTGSSSSSLLRPIREVPVTMASDITGIPAFELPEAVTAVRELRRATIAYENATDMLDRTRIGSRSGSVGSGNEPENGRFNGAAATASPLRKATS